jgi:hypothetical protein
MKGYNEALQHVNADVCTQSIEYLVKQYKLFAKKSLKNEPNTSYYSTQNTRFQK